MALGPVRPWVAAAANEISQRFGITTMYGVRPDTIPDHPAGLAVDFMVFTDKGKGDSVAAYVLANASRLGVSYLIWQQQIWNVARGDKAWRQMADRGSPTANHRDHVHVTFNSTAPKGGAIVDTSFGVPGGIIGGVIGGIPGEILGLGGLDPTTTGQQFGEILNTVRDINKALTFLSSAHNWLRLGEAIAGGLMILIALYSWEKVARAPATAVKSVQKSISKAGIPKVSE